MERPHLLYQHSFIVGGDVFLFHQLFSMSFRNCFICIALPCYILLLKELKVDAENMLGQLKAKDVKKKKETQKCYQQVDVNLSGVTLSLSWLPFLGC